MTGSTLVATCLLAAAAPMACRANNDCAAATSYLAPDVAAAAATPRAYPTFCSIPPTPTDAPPAQAVKTSVEDTRLAGRRLVQEAGPGTFPVGATSAFAARERAAATPPPPIPPPGGLDTQAFVRKSRALAAPPRGPR